MDAICFDRIFMRFFSIFEKFDLTKKQQMLATGLTGLEPGIP